MENNTYEGIPIGIKLRRKLANKVIYYVRYGKQEQRAYAIPYNPKTAGQQRWRTVFRAGVREWHTMTPAEKEPWIKEAKKHRTWSPFITFMSAWLKYLWKEIPMRVPDYDSGWVAISQNITITLTHNLGGNPEDYLVDLTGKSGVWGINKVRGGYDKDRTFSYGFWWRTLSATTILVGRGISDVDADEIRIKIWRYA